MKIVALTAFITGTLLLAFGYVIPGGIAYGLCALFILGSINDRDHWHRH